jgi:hypothetical protein
MVLLDHGVLFKYKVVPVIRPYPVDRRTKKDQFWNDLRQMGDSWEHCICFPSTGQFLRCESGDH